MSRPSSQPPPQLLFTWKDPDSSFIRLFLAILATLVGLTLFFIVFRVAYPDTRPVVTRPEQIIVLNPEVPAELALIHRATDRSFALLPSDTPLPDANAALNAMPRFRPSYEGFQLRLHERSSEEGASTLPPLFALSNNVLPPLPAPDVTSPPVLKSHLRLLVAGEVASRQPLATVLNDMPLAEPMKTRFQIAVNPEGRVVMAMPLSHLEDDAVEEQLQRAVKSLRFGPAKEAVQFGEVSFQWEGVDEP